MVFARLGGTPVGFVANQPRILAGTLDIAASQKGARFVLLRRLQPAHPHPGRHTRVPAGKGPRMARHDPARRAAGVRLRRGHVPRVCLVLRKAYGGAYIVMDSQGIGNDICLAWPGVYVAVMGAEGAVRTSSTEAWTPRAGGAGWPGIPSGDPNPCPAAERGFVDEVVDPVGHPDRAVRGARAPLSTKREAVAGRSTMPVHRIPHGKTSIVIIVATQPKAHSDAVPAKTARHDRRRGGLPQVDEKNCCSGTRRHRTTTSSTPRRMCFRVAKGLGPRGRRGHHRAGGLTTDWIDPISESFVK